MMMMVVIMIMIRRLAEMFFLFWNHKSYHMQARRGLQKHNAIPDTLDGIQQVQPQPYRLRQDSAHSKATPQYVRGDP